MFYYPFKQEQRISQIFGVNPQIYKRFGLKAHNGLDWACPSGMEVLAIDYGIVLEVGNEGFRTGYGKYVKIQIQGHQITYGHFSKQLVKVGDILQAGQTIGLSGNTGFSTGPHLHITAKQTDESNLVLNKNNGYLGAINPQPLISITPTIPDKIPSLYAKDEWDFWLKEGILSDASLPKATLTKQDFAVILKRYHEKYGN